MTVERAVVDTNVLISAALSPSGVPRAVVNTIRQGGGALLFADETIKEMHSRLFRTKFDRYVGRTIRTRFLVQLLGVCERVSITGAKLGCPDPDDDKFLETAMVGEAECLISGDRHLLDMTAFRGVPILTPTAFLNSLTAPG